MSQFDWPITQKNKKKPKKNKTKNYGGSPYLLALSNTYQNNDLKNHGFAN
jgi:hypothetical protein